MYQQNRPRTNNMNIRRAASNVNRPNTQRGGKNTGRNLPANNSTSTFQAVKTQVAPMLLVKQDKVKTVKAKSRKPFPVSAVVMVTICTLLLMFLVVSYVQINEYTIEVASLRGKLTEMGTQEKELNLKLSEKNDLIAVENYATEELGMVKGDQLTKKYISLNREDKIEVVENQPSQDATVVAGVMSAIADNFTGLWEYME